MQNIHSAFLQMTVDWNPTKWPFANLSLLCTTERRDRVISFKTPLLPGTTALMWTWPSVHLETSGFCLAVVQTNEHLLAFKQGCNVISYSHKILSGRPQRCPNNYTTQHRLHFIPSLMEQVIKTQIHIMSIQVTLLTNHRAVRQLSM